MSELIQCKTCGGKVSAAATRCPHCGEPDFKSASYHAEEQQHRQRHLSFAETTHLLEHDLEVYPEGEFPGDWYIHIRFYGTEIYGRYKPLSQAEYHPHKQRDNREPMHIGLVPGTYRVRFQDFKSPTYDYIGEIPGEATFTITDKTKKLTINIQKKLFSKHYKIASVTVVDQ